MEVIVQFIATKKNTFWKTRHHFQEKKKKKWPRSNQQSLCEHFTPFVRRQMVGVLWQKIALGGNVETIKNHSEMTWIDRYSTLRDKEKKQKTSCGELAL